MYKNLYIVECCENVYLYHICVPQPCVLFVCEHVLIRIPKRTWITPFFPFTNIHARVYNISAPHDCYPVCMRDITFFSPPLFVIVPPFANENPAMYSNQVKVAKAEVGKPHPASSPIPTSGLIIHVTKPVCFSSNLSLNYHGIYCKLCWRFPYQNKAPVTQW